MTDPVSLPPPKTDELEALHKELLAEYLRQRALLDGIFEADPGGLAVVEGPDLLLAYANPAYRFLCPPVSGDLIGQKYEEIWSSEEDNCYAREIREVVSTGRPFLTLGFERHFPDGETRIFTLQARRIPWGENPAALVVLWDTTEQVHSRESLQRQNWVMQSINHILEEAINSEDEEQLGVACLQVAQELTGSQFGFIAEIGRDGLLHNLAISDPGWEACAIQAGSGSRNPPGNFRIHGIYGKVLTSQRSLISNDPENHPDKIGLPEGHPPLTAFLGTPFLREGKVVGMVAVGNRPGGYRIEDQEALEALAPAIVGALDRVRSEVSLRIENSERRRVELGLEETNARLVALVEASAGLLEGIDPVTRLDEFFRSFSDRLKLDVYVQYNVSQDRTHLELGSWAGFPEKYKRLLNKLEFGQAVCGTVAQIRRPMVVTHVQESNDRKTHLIRLLGVRTYACHPLIVNDRLLGTLSFGSRRVDSFDPETIRILRTFCHLVAAAMDRKHTEESLRASQEKLTALLVENKEQKDILSAQSSIDPGGQALVVGEELIFHYVNPAYRALTPHPEIDPINQLYGLIWPPEEGFVHRAIIEDVLHTGSDVHIQRHPRRYPDGTTRYYTLHAHRLEWRGQPAVYIVLWDTTDLIKAQEDARISAGRFRTISEGMNEGFSLQEIICDEQGMPIDFRLLEVNPAFERLTGLTREQVIGKLRSEIAPLSEIDIETLQLFGRVALTGEPAHLERYISKTRRYLQILSYQLEPGKFANLFMDITGQKLSERFSQAFTQIDRLINSTQNWEDILQNAVSRGAEALESGTAALSLRRGKDWVVSYVYGFPADVIGMRMNDEEERHAILAIHSRQPVAISDAFNDERVNTAHMRKWGVRSVLVVPILLHDDVVGVIFFNYYEQAFEFTQAHIDFATQLAGSLSLALENARLVHSLEAVDITDRQISEEAAREHAVRIELQRRLLAQREQERLQIARELHDGPMQDLTAVGFAIADLAATTDDPAMAHELQKIREMLREQIGELRSYASELRPPTLTVFGLSKAIRAHVESFREKHPDIYIKYQEEQEGDLLPEDIRLALYRIYQECITNTIKHAQATRIYVRLEKNADYVSLEVKDNGLGFNIPHDWLNLAQQGHLGLIGIRERAEAIGGKLVIESQPGEGALVRVLVDLKK